MGWTSAVALCLAFALPWPDPDPPAADLARWPSVETIDGWQCFHYRYLETLRGRYSWDLARREQILEAISETESLWQPWDTLRDAHHAYSPRALLGSLRSFRPID